MKKIFNYVFVDGLSGMAQGLFATLIIGTIIQQVGIFVGGAAGDLVFLIGKMAAAMVRGILSPSLSIRTITNCPGSQDFATLFASTSIK